MQVINTNVMSLNSQRHLNNSSSALATSIERLSSGSRINSAKDDAAGLAISERFTTQIRGMDQAARNANDGISLAQTAEGALGEIGNNLQRIRELAVQSRNATNSTDDRAALQKEVAQLKSEIDRVADTTNFNGTKLLDGSFTAQSFQVGANQGETIDISAIADANIAALGEWTQTEQATVTSGALTAGAVSGLTVAGQTVGDVTVTADAAGASALAAAINTALTDGGVSNVVASTDGANVVLTASDGADIVIGGTVTNSGFTAGTTEPTETDMTGFAALDISTAEGADSAMLAMDAALKSINDARADLGAVQNRFTSVIANLQTGSENLSASRSRIKDADFAKETAEMTRTQILQQAGTAMLAQANQAPQGVMSLLR